jgi:D-glycero-D-manno-heptose 1,7-bisphosphate phosphatase
MSTAGSKAAFLDRDGVINEDRGYVSRIADFQFIEGIFPLAAFLQKQGYLLIVVSNQSGVARGYFGEAEVQHLHEWMVDRFREHGITIARCYYCPHYAQGALAEYRIDCQDRKPRPGMLLRAQREFGLELSHSLLIGNSETDIAAARAAGLGASILVSPVGNGDTTATGATWVVPTLYEIPRLLQRRTPAQQ